MKRLFLLFFILLYAGISFANPVSVEKAQGIATIFFQSLTSKQITQPDIKLVYNCIDESNLNDQSYFYIFNYGTNHFVVVSGDDAAYPILGYSIESAFNTSKIPQNFQKWFEGYKQQIYNIRKNALAATSEIQAQWLRPPVITRLKANSVSPLLKTKWDQMPYFNEKCPFDTKENEFTVTGCVATAMAQIMKFWEYPAKGLGFHSYTHNDYGTLSANFGGTEYNWSAMPDELTSANADVATLMYHCGVSVDMEYGVEGSAANTFDVIYALKHYFGYDKSMKGVYREDYSETDWIALLKNELDNGRPIQYAGTGSEGGHSFVCDGYDINSYFHINWGWGGSSDGYFLINVLNPSTLGTGGGAGGFVDYQRAIICIKPATNTSFYDLTLYESVNASKNTISYGSPFSVSTNLVNDGTSAFNGDFCVAVSDYNGEIVDIVDSIKGVSLAAGSHFNSNLVFSTDGLLSVLPGKYYVSLFYREVGENWVELLAPNSNYYDYDFLNVINDNGISVASAITLNPATEIFSGGQLSVSAKIYNDYVSTFNGSVDVSLYNLDGDSLFSIQTLDNISISSAENNDLTFATNTLNVPPGSYYLAFNHKWTSYSWELTGALTGFVNPIKIVVKEAPIVADKYEQNEDVTTAYSFTPTFTNNSSTVNIDDANYHTSSDIDYYKIELGDPYEYSLSIKLEDKGYSENKKMYSFDGLISYSFDGVNWSESFDNVIPAVVAKSEKTVYLRVSPYFKGGKGTYFVNVVINRTPVNSVEENTKVPFDYTIKPNPASDKIVIAPNSSENTICSVSISTIEGDILFKKTDAFEKQDLELSIDGYVSGMYFISVTDCFGNVYTKKLIVK